MDGPLKVLLDTETYQAELVFEYPSHTTAFAGPLINGTIYVNRSPLRLEYGFVCFGYDLDRTFRSRSCRLA